jgi:hypothetical protein
MTAPTTPAVLVSTSQPNDPYRVEKTERERERDRDRYRYRDRERQRDGDSDERRYRHMLYPTPAMDCGEHVRALSTWGLKTKAGLEAVQFVPDRVVDRIQIEISTNSTTLFVLYIAYSTRRS